MKKGRWGQKSETPHSHDCTAIISGKLRLMLSFFQKLSGGNFTRASRLSGSCYCFLCVIMLWTCCHSNWKRKRDFQGIFHSFLGTVWNVSVPLPLTFSSTRKRALIETRYRLHTTKHSYHQIFVDARLTNAPCVYRISTEIRRCSSSNHRTSVWSDRVQRRAGHPQL